MSELGKFFWVLAGIFLVPFVVLRSILGYWWGAPYIFIGLSIPVILFLLAIVLDYRTYVDFFSMKTTKQGLNTGTIILLMLVFIIAVNVLSVLNNQSWDLTEEKIYTLSGQSKKVLNDLDDDLTLTIFYPGAQVANTARRYKEALKLYINESSKFKLKLVDAYLKNALAQEYFGTLPKEDRSMKNRVGNQVTLFLDYKSNRRKIRLTQAGVRSLEEKVTNAIIKITRSTQRKIYFLKGHGEKEASKFKEALKDMSFIVKDFEYYGKDSLPDQVDLLVIIGMKTPLYEDEFNQLKAYAERGGKFFIALDPGEKNEANRFLNLLGVDYKNNYIVNDLILILGLGNTGALGFKNHPEHEITRDFSKLKSPSSVFSIASEVRALTNVENIREFKHKSLIESDFRSYTVDDLKQKGMRGKKQQRMYRYRTLALLVEGILNPTHDSQQEKAFKKDEDRGEGQKGTQEESKNGDQEKSEEGVKKAEEDSGYKAVVFGDSDFVASERMFSMFYNKDIALNTVAYLLGEGDLVSIRPKEFKKTKLSITTVKYNSIVLGEVFLPAVFIIFGLGLWFRRKNA